MVHAGQEIRNSPAPRCAFSGGEKLWSDTQKHSGNANLLAKVMMESAFLPYVIWLRSINQKNDHPLCALGVLFSEGTFDWFTIEGGFREVLDFATWNFFPLKKINDHGTGQNPGLGRHRNSFGRGGFDSCRDGICTINCPRANIIIIIVHKSHPHD